MLHLIHRNWFVISGVIATALQTFIDLPAQEALPLVLVLIFRSFLTPTHDPVLPGDLPLKRVKKSDGETCWKVPEEKAA